MEETELLSQVRRIDHLWIVSDVARKIRLVEIIDRMIPPAPQRVVTAGEAVLALVLNGLGFVSRPLYLIPAYFKTKPVGTLIRSGLTEEDLNEFTLGRALNDIHEAGLSALFLYPPVPPWGCRRAEPPSSTSIRPLSRSPDGIRRAKPGRTKRRRMRGNRP